MVWGRGVWFFLLVILDVYFSRILQHVPLKILVFEQCSKNKKKLDYKIINNVENVLESQNCETMSPCPYLYHKIVDNI